jgi:hypothetical protein
MRRITTFTLDLRHRSPVTFEIEGRKYTLYIGDVPAAARGLGPAFDAIHKRLERNKIRLKYQRQGFQLSHGQLAKDVSEVFARFRSVGDVEGLEIPRDALDKAFRSGVNALFDRAGLDSFTGRWRGVNRHYDLAGSEITADASTWHMTWGKGSFDDGVYLQTVVGSKERHHEADRLPELSEKKVDLALNVYRKDIGITGWLSTFVEFRNEMALIAYELQKGVFLWIGQVLTEKLEPVENEKLFWMFFEWYEAPASPDARPSYCMYGLMFEIDFDAGTARHFESQGVRKARFTRVEA